MRRMDLMLKPIKPIKTNKTNKKEIEVKPLFDLKLGKVKYLIAFSIEAGGGEPN